MLNHTVRCNLIEVKFKYISRKMDEIHDEQFGSSTYDHHRIFFFFFFLKFFVFLRRSIFVIQKKIEKIGRRQFNFAENDIIKRFCKLKTLIRKIF